MNDYEPARITELSTTTIVFLIVFLPGIALVTLIALSYAATA